MAKYLKGDSAKAITGQFIEVDDELNEESDNLITNSAIAEVIATLQNRISVLESTSMPINSFYTQYPHETDDGTYVGFRDEDKPENLFGGEWRELFKNKGVFFRTEGGLAENKTRPPGANTTPVGRTNGIQEYAIKNISGSLVRVQSPNTMSRSGAFTASEIGSTGYSGSGRNWYSVTFDASLVVNIAGEVRPTNMLIKVWQRIE